MPRSSSLLYYLIFVSIGFVYPAYCSLVAIETEDTKDDSAWLMYWIIFALFNFFEYFADFLLSWFPLYPLAKLGFVAWCVAPIGTNGAFYIYKAFVGPFFHTYGENINDHMTIAVEYIKYASNYISNITK